MKKQLGTLASLILMSFLVFVWISCSCIHREHCHLFYTEATPIVCSEQVPCCPPTLVSEHDVVCTHMYAPSSNTSLSESEYTNSISTSEYTKRGNEPAQTNSYSSYEYSKTGTNPEYWSTEQRSNSNASNAYNYSESSNGSEQLKSTSASTTANSKSMSPSNNTKSFNSDFSSSQNGSDNSMLKNTNVNSRSVNASEYSKTETETTFSKSKAATAYSKAGVTSSGTASKPVTESLNTASDPASNSKSSTESYQSKSTSEYSKTGSNPFSKNSNSTSETLKSGSDRSSNKTTLATDDSKFKTTSETSKNMNEPFSTKSTNGSPYSSSNSSSEYSRTTNESRSVDSSNAYNNSNSAYNNSKSMNDSAYSNSKKGSESASVSAPFVFKNENDASKTVSKGKGCKFTPSCEFSTGVNVKVKNPKACMLGSQYPVEFEVTAIVDVHDVVLIATIPEGVTYLSSQPEAKVNGRELTWNFDSIKQAQKVMGKIVLKTDQEGELCTCFSVTSTANACCSTVCARPVLKCEKSGPEEVCKGDPINYTVTVANTGTYPAEDVILVITDTAAKDEDKVVQKPLNFKLGTIENGLAKKVDFSVKATKRGKICLTAVATSSNAKQTSCDLCTLVTACAIDCRKEGPKEARIGQNADYKITIVNTGDKPLHDMVVTETVNAATSIIAAENANISDKKAVWKLKELKVGETVTLNVTLTSRTTGTYTNNTAVTNKEGYNTACSTTTNWKGRAALDVSMSTSQNSIFTGETTRYKITVTNQGQETDSNVKVTVIFPAGLEPVEASGATNGTISGQNVTFASYPNMALRQILEYFVTVKANVSGDLRPKVQVGSDSIKPPITQEESLIVN